MPVELRHLLGVVGVVDWHLALAVEAAARHELRAVLVERSAPTPARHGVLAQPVVVVADRSRLCDASCTGAACPSEPPTITSSYTLSAPSTPFTFFGLSHGRRSSASQAALERPRRDAGDVVHEALRADDGELHRHVTADRKRRARRPARRPCSAPSRSGAPVEICLPVSPRWRGCRVVAQPKAILLPSGDHEPRTGCRSDRDGIASSSYRHVPTPVPRRSVPVSRRRPRVSCRRRRRPATALCSARPTSRRHDARSRPPCGTAPRGSPRRRLSGSPSGRIVDLT